MQTSKSKDLTTSYIIRGWPIIFEQLIGCCLGLDLYFYLRNWLFLIGFNTDLNSALTKPIFSSCYRYCLVECVIEESDHTVGFLSHLSYIVSWDGFAWVVFENKIRVAYRQTNLFGKWGHKGGNTYSALAFL